MEAKLRFFNVDVVLRIDVAEVVASFLLLYQNFQIERDENLHEPHLNFRIVTQADPPYMLVNGLREPLPDDAMLPSYLYNRITTALFNAVQTHLLFHAGVVSWGETGIMIVADSFYGKTTLSMRLIREGFQLLSDETAAICLADGWVDPCFRNLNVRRGTAQLSRHEQLHALSVDADGREIVAIKRLQAGCLGKRVPINHIFVLEDRDRPKDQSELIVTLSTLPDSLRVGLRSMVLVEAIRVVQLANAVCLQIVTKQRSQVFECLDALCRQMGIFILDVQMGVAHRPNFRSPVSLTPINIHQAAQALLSNFQGGYQSRLLEGGAAQFYFTLCQQIENANCYALQVGSLEDMVTEVRRTVCCYQ